MYCFSCFFFFFKQKTAYEISTRLEFRRVLFRSVGTDAGHTATGFSAEWALHNDRRIADYGHRAVHRSAEVTRALIVAYYGRPPEHSYFVGCSNGGRQALMEAQRYPADFDGIVAIAPWLNVLE